MDSLKARLLGYLERFHRLDAKVRFFGSVAALLLLVFFGGWLPFWLALPLSIAALYVAGKGGWDFLLVTADDGSIAKAPPPPRKTKYLPHFEDFDETEDDI